MLAVSETTQLLFGALNVVATTDVVLHIYV